MKNLNKIILAIEESILAHISDEDVSVTKVSQLTDRLMKLYKYRDERETFKRSQDPHVDSDIDWEKSNSKKKEAPVKDASKDSNDPVKD